MTYRRMTVAQKLAYAIARQWRPATQRCLLCGFRVLVDQREDHESKRCPGAPGELVELP